jgi:threonyl-tRNA synthetase
MSELNKNDHREIGRELDLFTFSDVVGKGLPLYTEKGAAIRRELERFIVDEEIKRGYKHVITPDIAKLDLYKKSGHYPYYKDTMYSPIDIDGEEFMLRPMTCPHHYELYLSKPHSYRELPMRIAEMAKLYRYEASGNLAGLIRVRSFCLADAHIICANNEQASSEILQALELISYVAGVFGLKKGEDFWYRLSLGNRKDENKKYFKDDVAWENAEGILRDVLQNQDVRFYEAEDEAAFYGPKVDVQMKDKRGQENTAFTVQYDFLGAGRFNLTYTDSDGTEKLASAVIHRSSIGATERIMAFLIEHYEGAFPTWLSPVQVKVLSISDKHLEYAKSVYQKLMQEGVRVEIDESNETLGKKVREAKMQKIPYLLVIGDKEVESNEVTVESRTEKLGTMSTQQFVDFIQKEIKERK